MKDEIKEILIYAKEHGYFDLDYNESELLLDYITNLQEQLHKASLDIQELTERDIWCPSNCDKLTNLQEENQRLKELCDKYEEEHSTAFKLWTMKMEEIPTYEEKKELQNRIDEAIEYINKNYDTDIEDVFELLEILQGKSDE